MRTRFVIVPSHAPHLADPLGLHVWLAPCVSWDARFWCIDLAVLASRGGAGKFGFALPCRMATHAPTEITGRATKPVLKHGATRSLAQVLRDQNGRNGAPDRSLALRHHACNDVCTTSSRNQVCGACALVNTMVSVEPLI